LTCLVSI